MINENIINSYSRGRTFTIYRYEGQCSFNNSTKSNPGWYGDMLGDWREEIIVPDNTKIDHINDLQGRKIDTPRRGIYIRNGRKVVIK